MRGLGKDGFEGGFIIGSVEFSTTLPDHTKIHRQEGGVFHIIIYSPFYRIIIESN